MNFPPAPLLVLSAAFLFPPFLRACLNDEPQHPIQIELPKIDLPLTLNRAQMPMVETVMFRGDFSEAKTIPNFPGYAAALGKHYGREEWTNHLALLDSQLKGNSHPTFELRTAQGVALVHLGQTKQALEIFLALEREKSGTYRVAANLGTTFELLGDNESARQWIQEGIRRNAGSHRGTEWLHVRILEAKLQLAKDPRWLETHSVLGLDFGGDAKVRKPDPLDKAQSERTVLALLHQLRERLEFVKPPEAVVGDLLFDLANLAALESDPAQAAALYELCLAYKAPRAAIAEKRLKYYSAGKT